ncbi:MAG: transglutaminase domain-containing protein [Acidobacteriota bacterium]
MAGQRRPGGGRCRLLVCLVFVCALVGSWLVAPRALAADSSGGLAVAGTESLQVRIPSQLPVEPYANWGYRLERLPGGEYRVSVSAEALRSRVAFPLDSQGSRAVVEQPKERFGNMGATALRPAAAHPEIRQLSVALSSGARSHYQAVSRVLGWVSRNIDYRLDRSQSQAAVSVLHRRSAYCTGSARLSVALLGALGIEAREVPGVVVEESGGAFYHRWIEVLYPDRGWVFSDPMHHHHYVPATYLPLAAEQVPSSGLEGLEVISREASLGVVDVFGTAAPGVLGRRNEEAQQAAALRVRLRPQTPGVAWIEGQGQRHRLPLGEAGEATFVGLEAGRYRLTVRWPSGEERSAELLLHSAQRRLVEWVPKQIPGEEASVADAARYPLSTRSFTLGEPLGPPPFVLAPEVYSPAER